MARVIVNVSLFLLAAAFACWTVYVVALGVAAFFKGRGKGEGEEGAAGTPAP